MNEMVAAVAGRRPRTLVPLLAAVFIIAWGLLTMLVVMQDRMIDAQSDLIHSFASQSVSGVTAKPAHMNGRTAIKPGEKQVAGKSSTMRNNQAAITSHKVPSAQGTVSQIPLSERASVQSPSSQVKPKAANKPGRSARKGRSPFSPPPSEITDPSDQRRVSISI